MPPDTILVRDLEGQPVSSGALATGMSASTAGEEFLLVVPGDCDGNGAVNRQDLKEAQALLLEGDGLSTPYRRAADLDGDGALTTQDLALLSRSFPKGGFSLLLSQSPGVKMFTNPERSSPMPILYDSDRKVFKLDAKGFTYAMMVYRENYLVHLYAGAPIPDTDLSYLMYRGWFDSLSPSNPKVEDPYFSLDIQPLEYPAGGTGDFRISALSVRGEAGDAATDLRYVSHKIYPGKPALPGLPATFDREGAAQTLEVELLDAVTGVKATLLYTVFEDYPAIARSARLENTGARPVSLERAYSACLDLPTMDWDMVHLYGRWAKENTTARHPLQHGIQAVHSKRGMTGPNHNPFLAWRPGAPERSPARPWGSALSTAATSPSTWRWTPGVAPGCSWGSTPRSSAGAWSPGSASSPPRRCWPIPRRAWGP